jgi:Phytanoyl-CoA dioxygenase (PhyH)
LALGLSFLLLTVAVVVSASLGGGGAGISFFEHFWSTPSAEDLAHRKLGPLPTIGPATIFEVSAHPRRQRGGGEPYSIAEGSTVNSLVSKEMSRSFEEDGVIAIRGLLDPNLLDELDRETMKLVVEQREKDLAKAKERPRVLTGRPRPAKQFFAVRQGAIFLQSPVKQMDAKAGENDVEHDRNSDDVSAFAKVALMSEIPNVVASLLDFDADACTDQTVRVMSDIFLAKDEEEYVCGWHVDDIGFWPALADAPGINAWVALDDMPVSRGGGFALAVGSHKAQWRQTAYNVTGSTHSFPKEGYKSSSDVLQNRPGNGTCNIKESAPHLHRRMEELKRIYEIKRGDVIFHTRWLFHRTVPFDADAVSNRVANNGQPLLYRRYSIRYGPGSSIVPPGYGTEPSVLSNPENGGRTADEVSRLDGPWYPKAWPQVCPNELAALKILATERLPAAVEESEKRRKLTRPRRTREH